MESLRNLALNAVPLNAFIPAYFVEEVRIARIFKQLIINGEFITRSLTNEEVQAMELLKVGFIPIGWKRFKLFSLLHSCKSIFGHQCVKKWLIRDTLQNIMIKFGICKECNTLLFKLHNIKIAFSIERNEVISVDKMDSGHFNYITEKHLICEPMGTLSSVMLYSYRGYTLSYPHNARLLIRAFPTVKPMVILRKDDSTKINAGYSLQEFFKINRQWWGHDTIIDENILQLYQSVIVYYVCTELTDSLYVDLSIRSDNIEKIKQLLSSRSWHIETIMHDEFSTQIPLHDKNFRYN
jgi:DNA-dependent RNA polymerase auxiliary subunit epsilon